MSAVKFGIKICLFIALGSTCFGSIAANNALPQLVEISQSRLAKSPLSQRSAIELNSSSWLTGLPSVSLSYLGDLDNSNIYEQELSLNLPIKTFSLHQSDKQLVQLSQALQAQQTRLQKLYLSGLLRQSMWDQRLAAVKLNQLDRKSRLLSKLYTQQKKLADAGELPLVNILLLEKELVDIELEQIGFKQQQTEALTLFTSLTGLNQLPDDIVEKAIDIGEFSAPEHVQTALMQHPSWLLHSLQLQQKQLMLQSQQSGEQDPWTLSLTAKETAVDQFNDKHLGIGINVPLSFSSALSQSDVSMWQKDFQEQSVNGERIYLELTNQIQRLAIQQQNLRAQQTLLTRGVSLSRSITENLAQVKNQNQIGYEIWLRRYIDALDTEARLALNQVTLQQLHSQQLQALGISL
ncbi:metal transporter [Shewanella sp. HL-SH5]|uniref:metal transporter n=1 Tax=Shewanella sp. HL-SH5 TaxID=3436241 RepID=UPI003EB8DFA7